MSSDSDESTSSSGGSSSDESRITKKQKTFKIPKLKYASRTKSEIQRMREDLPNLSHHSEDTFRSMSWTELIRLDNKLDSNGKSGKKLTEKMAKNLEKCKKNPKKIEAGEDNRANIIHKSRFFGGHICKNEDIWLTARENIGISGLDPISRYDSEGVGMEGNLNSHVWAALHNPGSKDISIKMLSPEALKTARGESEKDSATCKKEFDSSNDIRLALSTLRTANQFIHPWNFSLTTLDYFLTSVNFGEKELVNCKNNEKFSFLTSFIDKVILHNAEAWDDSKTFMSAQKISNKWMSDIMRKCPKSQQKETQKPKNTNFTKPNQFQNKNQSPNQNQNQNSNPRPYIPPGICRRFSFNACPNQNDNFCSAPWDANKKLNHQCAFWNKNDNKFCMSNHSLQDHK